MVQIDTEQQGKKIKEIKTIDKNPVTTALHKTLNHCVGTVYSEAMSQSTEEEILEKLQDQGVIKVERMKKKTQNGLENTNRYIITFNRTKLQSLIKLAEWHREIVEMYIPTPMRCGQCQRLGHAKKWCRRTSTACSRCSGEGHLQKYCPNEAYCINCRSNHPPTDRNCDAYKFKCEVLAAQAREHVTFHEANERVKERYIEQGKSASFAVRNGRQQDPYPKDRHQSEMNTLIETIQP